LKRRFEKAKKLLKCQVSTYKPIDWMQVEICTYYKRVQPGVLQNLVVSNQVKRLEPSKKRAAQQR
jgi:hypothetical protein